MLGPVTVVTVVTVVNGVASVTHKPTVAIVVTIVGQPWLTMASHG